MAALFFLVTILARLLQWPRRGEPWATAPRIPLDVALVCLIAIPPWAAGRIHRNVRRAGETRIFFENDVPPARVAVVFGAKVYPDATVSAYTAQRLSAALRLYRNGRVEKILVSGDNGRMSYNEPAVMKAWLVAAGVPEQDVGCDYAGFRTLDTCARARKVWNLRRAILVTHRYHLPRALFLADAYGLEAVGVACDGRGRFVSKRQRIREPLARLCAWLDVRVLGRGPRFLGRPERL